MAQFDLHIQNMNCSSCVAKIEGALNREGDVESCSVNFATGKATVKGTIDPERAAAIVTDLGYPASTVIPKEKGYLWLKVRTIFALLFSIPLVLTMFGVHLSHSIELVLATIVQFGAGYSFYIGSYKSLKSGSANMDV